MMHWLAVGHFDPIDPIDKSEKPYRYKPLRPITRESAEQAVAAFGMDVDEYLGYSEGGYVICNWSLAPHALWDRVRAFAYFLADREQALVLDENFMAWWPPEASRHQQVTWGWGISQTRPAGPS